MSDVDSDKMSSSVIPQSPAAAVSTSMSDLKLNVSIKNEDFDFDFPHITTSTITPPPISASASTPITFNENSLSVIEQFQFNDDLQMSCDNIALAKDIENLNDLESQVSQTCDVIPSIPIDAQTKLQPNPQPEQKSASADCTKSVIIKPKCNQVFLNKSVIVKQSPVKIIKITTPGVIKKIPKIDKKFVQISKIDSSKIFVLNSKCSQKPINIQPINNLNVSSTVPSPPLVDVSTSISPASVPSLSYESWLDNIIEILNDSIILQDSNNIKHTFHVHEVSTKLFIC